MDRGTLNLVSKLPFLHSDKVGLAGIIKNVLDEEQVKSDVVAVERDGPSAQCVAGWRIHEVAGTAAARDMTQKCQATNFTQPCPAHSSLIFTQSCQATSFTQLYPATSFTQLTPATNFTQPTLASSFTQPVVASNFTQPVVASNFTQPCPASSFTQPCSSTNQTPIQSTKEDQATQGPYKPCSTNIAHRPNMPYSTDFLPTLHKNCSTDFTPVALHKTSTYFSGTPHKALPIDFSIACHKTSPTGDIAPSIDRQGTGPDESCSNALFTSSCTTDHTATNTAHSTCMQGQVHKNTSGYNGKTLSFFQPGKFCPAPTDETSSPSHLPVESQRTDMDMDQMCNNITPIEIGDIDEEECEAITQHLLRVSKSIFLDDDPATQMAKLQKQQGLYLMKSKELYQATLATSQDSSLPGDPKRSSREELLYASMAYIEMTIIKMVKLAKQIPGFKELSMDDQASLIRENRTEGFYIWANKNFVDSSSKSFSTVHGAHISMEQMTSVFSKEFIENSFNFNKRIRNLALTQAEETLISAISITFTDRSRLHNPMAVQNIQNKLITCLLHVITQSGQGNVGRRLGQLFTLLTDLRNNSEVDFLEVKKGLMSSQYQNSTAVQEFL